MMDEEICKQYASSVLTAIVFVFGIGFFAGACCTNARIQHDTSMIKQDTARLQQYIERRSHVLLDGEPYVLLRGVDRFAATNAYAYARFLEEEGFPDKAREVRAEAIAIERWQRDNSRHVEFTE